MTRSNSSRVLTITLLCLLAAPAFADQRWVELQTGRAGQAPVVDVREVADGLVVEMDLFGFYAAEIDVEGTTYTSLDIPECGRSGAVGEPDMPFRNLLLPVPNGPEVSIASVTATQVTAMDNLLVLPVSEPLPDCGPPMAPGYSCDAKAYALDGWFPEAPVRIASEVVVRGQRFIQLEVTPLQFNPVRRELIARPHLELHIALAGTVNEAAEATKLRRAKEFFPTLIQTPGGAALPELNPTGIEYLIIAHDSFLAQVEPLAEWKRLKGFAVEVVPSSTVGTTPTAIENWMQNRYDTDPDLTYVLLVGDHQQIPAKDVGGFVSDLYYSCLDGSDYFPDVVMGRISVQTTTDCANVVDKILTHDRTPDGGGWHGDYLMAAKLEDYYSPTCEADRWFFETGTHAMHFIRDVIGMGIYTAATSESLSCSPHMWRASSYPHRFPGYAGQAVPPADSALFTPGSQATQDVTDAINAGVSIVQHRDHGDVTLWGEPHYTNSNINALANGTRTPVVYSINCLTGTFDHSSDCFAEAFMKKYPGGAVGVIAATEVSYSGHNDLLAHGMYDCFWDAYDPANGTNIYPHSFRPAEALMYGKYHMYNWEGPGGVTEIEFEMFHWHGDPEMMAFTATPVAPTVTVDPTVPVGATEMTVLCTAEGAQVAITDNGTLLGRDIVTGGSAVVSFDPPPDTPTTLDVVVTGHNLLPWEGSTEVIVPEGPWLSYASHLLDDSAGNADGILNPGESAVLPITVENVGAEAGTGISGLLSTGSGHCTVTDPAASFPDAAIGAQVQSLPNHFAFTVDGGVSHGAAVPFTLDWTADGPHDGATAFAIPVCEALIISGVTVIEITGDSALVGWTTSVPSTSVVNYGTSAPLGGTVEDTALVTSHELRIDGLEACTDYLFDVMSDAPGCYQATDDNGGAHYQFETYGRTVFLDETFNTDPGWEIDNGGNTHGWAFGQPTGQGGEYGGPDPTSGHTDANVYGVNLSGDYDNSLLNDQLRLVTPSLDLSEATAVTLKYWRWLCVEQPTYDHARVQVSVGGGGWVAAWENDATLEGGAWEEIELDISGQAAGQSDVRIRWTVGVTDSAWRYCGWNIDDIIVEGETPCGESDIFADGFEAGDCSAWTAEVE